MSNQRGGRVTSRSEITPAKNGNWRRSFALICAAAAILFLAVPGAFGQTSRYLYTGSEQPITLFAGQYNITAYGAEGGPGLTGASGGNGGGSYAGSGGSGGNGMNSENGNYDGGCGGSSFLYGGIGGGNYGGNSNMGGYGGGGAVAEAAAPISTHRRLRLSKKLRASPVPMMHLMARLS